MISTSNSFSGINLGTKALSLVLGAQSAICFTKGIMGSNFFESNPQTNIKKLNNSEPLTQRLQHIAYGCLYALAALVLYNFDANSKQILQTCQNDLSGFKAELGSCETDLESTKGKLNEKTTELQSAKELANEADLKIQELQKQLFGNSTVITKLQEALTQCTNKSQEISEKLNKLDVDFPKIKSEKEECERNNTLLFQNLKEANDNITALTLERDGCNSTYTLTYESNKRLESIILNHTQEIAALKLQAGQSSQLKEELESKVEELKKQLKACQNPQTPPSN